jgi:hypothetical protein
MIPQMIFRRSREGAKIKKTVVRSFSLSPGNGFFAPSRFRAGAIGREGA